MTEPDIRGMIAIVSAYGDFLRRAVHDAEQWHMALETADREEVAAISEALRLCDGLRRDAARTLARIDQYLCVRAWQADPDRPSLTPWRES